MPVFPESSTVNWFFTFTSITVSLSTSSSVESDGVTTTVTEPIDSSLFIVSVVPEELEPPDPEVIIEITSATNFSISGVYKNMMLTQHTWIDNDGIIQSSVIPPKLGTYEKITQIDSPSIKIKPWKYIVTTSNDQTATITTSSISSTIGSPTITNTTATTGTSILTGTTSSSITSTTSLPLFTRITTVTSITSTTTNWDGVWQNQIVSKYAITATTEISTNTNNALTTSTFTMFVDHDSYDVVRDRILDPLLAGQPEP
jgi:hypothetical protein